MTEPAGTEGTRELVVRLYDIVRELEELHGRHFTPDGHLLGSLGEVLAAAMFGLKLEAASNKSYDAKTVDDRTVEIKATQGSSFALQADYDELPHFLIALRIRKDGSAIVIYNGPAAPVWAAAEKRQVGKNRQRRVRVSQLTALQATIPPDQRLAVLASPPAAIPPG